jgi:hypothetical protein
MPAEALNIFVQHRQFRTAPNLMRLKNKKGTSTEMPF